MPQPNSLTRDKWIKEANCRGMNPNLFFLEKENNSGTNKYPKEVIEACAKCPVLEQCQEWAILHESYGYQGGLTPSQRAKVRSRLNIILWEPQNNITGLRVNSRTLPTQSPIAHGTPAGYKQERSRGMAPCDECTKAHSARVRQSQAS